jgi:hypothetical protein
MAEKYKIIIPTGASWDWMRTTSLRHTLNLEIKGVKNIIGTNFLDEAMKAVENGPTLVIMDSIVCSANPDDNKTIDGAAHILAKAAKKNPECKTILLTAEPFDVKDKVDVYIDMAQNQSRKKLIEEVEKFIAKYN